MIRKSFSVTPAQPNMSIGYQSLGKPEIKVWIRGNIKWLTLLFLLVFVSYANALGNNFVSDDKGLIEQARAWTFASNFSQPNVFLRSFLYFITFQMFGLNSFVFRFSNILFHLGVVWLSFFFLSRTTNTKIAIFSASLFAVHPILVESITWISGGVYTQYSFFFIFSFVAYLFSQKNIMAYILSLVFFSLALLSSEKAIVLSLLFPLFEFLFGNIRKNWKKSLFYFISGLLLVIIYLPRLESRQIEVQGGSLSNQIIMNPFEQIPIAITSYIGLILWPDSLTLYHSEMVFSQIEYGIRFLFFFLFLISIGISYKKNKFIFFWLTFFIVTLLPTLTPLGISWVVAERYVYLGSLGIFVIIGLGIEKLADNKQRKMAVYAVFSLIVIALMMRTIMRNINWSDEDHLWLSAARTSPSSSQNHNNLGDYYGRHGDLANSINEFKRAIELKPNYADAYHNLGNAYRDAGKLNEAINSYKQAITYNQTLWQSYQNIAGIYFAKEDFVNARLYLEKGLKIDPKNAYLLTSLGLILYKNGNIQQAEDVLMQSIKIDPLNSLTQKIINELKNDGTK